MLLVFLISTKKQKQYFSAGFWSWRAWLFNRQQSVLCRLYFSPESKGAFVSRIRGGGGSWWICYKQTNQPFSPAEHDCKSCASIPQRLEQKPSLCHQNLQYVAHFYQHSLSFPWNAFCGTLNLNLAGSLWFLPVLIFLQLVLQAPCNATELPAEQALFFSHWSGRQQRLGKES